MDLCSSSCDLDDVQQPPLLLENNPTQDVATAQPAAAADTQGPSATEQVGIPTLKAGLPPTLNGPLPHQALGQARLAAHEKGIDALRHCWPSSQDRASMSASAGPVRVPLHGPLLPDRPQKRKSTSLKSGTDLGPTQALGAPHTFSGNQRNKGLAGLRETHLQTPPSSTSNPRSDQQRLPAFEGNRKTQEPHLVASRLTNMACTKKIKLEHTPPQARTADQCDIPGGPGWQSPAAPCPHLGNLPSQAYAAGDSCQMVEAIPQAPVQQTQRSPLMITGSQQQLQEVLSLFGGSTAVGLAAKESALTNLVMLVAHNMYTPVLHPSLQPLMLK